MKRKSAKHQTRNNNTAHAAADHEDAAVHRSGMSGRKQIIGILAILCFLVAGTIFAVLYASGYRLFVNQGQPKVSKTGILHVTSIPTSAQVYIDGHLTTATNSTINLSPKKYTVRISKDGYNDWQKDVQIQTEVVSGVEALLLPKAPTLQSVSTFGVNEALVDPSGTKLAFKIASQSARRNGIYIFDMTARTLPILQGQSSANQIADDTIDRFSESILSWSPDSKQLIASISAAPDQTSGQPAGSTYYLLRSDGLNETPQDITATINDTLTLWETQRRDKNRARLKSLKPKVAQFANKHFRILAWSPDDKKILYQASESADMPVFLKPRRIGNNWLYERRDLKKGAIYVYNITEDTNTRIIDTIDPICTDKEPTCTDGTTTYQKNPFTWFPDSEHLIYVNEKKIQMVETDGANMTTIYAGPFIDNYVYPWPDGSKLVILTNLGNPNVSPTLYTIGLK